MWLSAWWQRRKPYIHLLHRHGRNNGINDNMPWRTRQNQLKVNVFPEEQAESSHIYGGRRATSFHPHQSLRWAQLSAEKIACAHLVPRGEGSDSGACTRPSVLSEPLCGLVFYLTSHPVWQAKSNPLRQWATKENVGRLFCCQSCSMNLGEQNWGSSSKGEKRANGGRRRSWPYS